MRQTLGFNLGSGAQSNDFLDITAKMGHAILSAISEYVVAGQLKSAIVQHHLRTVFRPIPSSGGFPGHGSNPLGDDPSGPTKRARLRSYRCQLTFGLIFGRRPELLTSPGKVGSDRVLVKQNPRRAFVQSAIYHTNLLLYGDIVIHFTHQIHTMRLDLRTNGGHNHPNRFPLSWPVLNLRVAYFGQYPSVGAGLFPSRLTVNGPLDFHERSLFNRNASGRRSFMNGAQIPVIGCLTTWWY